jgi:hypothetical protein
MIHGSLARLGYRANLCSQMVVALPSPLACSGSTPA